MNDHHLDPPDEPEPPEWWMMLEDALGDEDMPQPIRHAVHSAMQEWIRDSQPGPEPDNTPEPDDCVENTCRTCGKPTDCIYCSDECAPNCPHGNRPGDCGHCDHLADLHHDAMRESRFR